METKLNISLTQTLKIAFLIILHSFVFSATSDAKSSVWKIQKGESTVYLGGTIHLLRASDYPLPEEYMLAFQASQILTFETDMKLLSSPKMAREMLLKLSYDDERTIKTETSPETYSQLEKYSASLGISLGFMKKAKPGMMMSALTVSELNKIGVNQEGIDMFFLTLANKQVKKTDFLESPQQQIAMLALLGIGEEDMFYQNMLAELNNTETLFLTMLKHWRSGDNQQLDIIINQEMKKNSPKMYHSLLVERNINWLPKIESYFKTEEVEFVLVGAAHLIGEDGLIHLLKDKGYQVEQLNSVEINK